MEVLYTNPFVKDLQKVKGKSLAFDIEQVIFSVKGASRISDIKEIKKLKGFTNAYRITMGQYRFGLYINGNTAEFARFMHRKEIYRYFP